jgi:hypothetical protein
MQGAVSAVDDPVNGQTVLTFGGAGGPGSGGTFAKTIYRSPVTMMTSSGLAPTTVASASAGGQFQTNRAGLTVVALHTYWAGAATTIKASLWGAAGSRLASGTLAVGGVGWYYVPFTVPYVITQGNTTPTDTVIAYAIWDTNSVSSTRLASAKSVAAYPLSIAGNTLGEAYAGPDIQWQSWSLFGAGDSIPVTDPANGDAYPVEPVIVNWSAKTNTQFTMPAVNQTVNVTLAANTVPYLHAGMTLNVQGAGVMLVSSVAADPVVSMINIGDPYNAIANTVIPAGSLVF